MGSSWYISDCLTHTSNQLLVSRFFFHSPKNNMFKYLTLATGAMAQMQSYLPPSLPSQQAAAPSSMGMGGMDPMMMMLLFKDDDSSSSSSSDSSKDLLPLMMMGGGMGGMDGQQGAMNPMMMMLLLDDDCKLPTTFAKLTDADKKSVARGEKFYTGSTPSTAVSTDLKSALTDVTDTNKALALKYVDYDYLKCSSKGSSSSMSDLLPLMMMGGMGGQGGSMGGMDPMMMMLLLGDDSSSSSNDLLPLMMMGGMGGQQGGQAGAMNPMMMMLLLDDEKKSEAACTRKYKLDHAFLWDTTNKKLVKETVAANIRTAVKDVNTNKGNYGYTTVATTITDYVKCITDAAGVVGDDSKSSSSMKDLLPLMLLGGGQGGMGGMDPMMMMLLLKD